MSSTVATITLLVCTKGKCAKNKSEKTCKVLREIVEERGLEAAVEVKKCSCLGYCKEGPNVMVEETGKVYREVTPKKAEKVLTKLGLLD